MQYSPKLKIAMGQIKKILDQHDIAGQVILHTPGFAEYIVHVNPSYSLAKIEDDRFKLKANLKDDFNGDKAAMNKKIEDTSNMLHCLTTVGAGLTRNLTNASKALDDISGAFHTGNGHSYHTTQNN